MTQALNLANFANNLNTSGATSNAGLQNSAVTVTAGTGLSGGGAVSLGGTVSLANAGVTSVAAGTGISVSASTGAVTISASGAGTVTSVATGNGLSGGTITSTGTLAVACPSFNSVGSYTLGLFSNYPNIIITAGSNYSPTQSFGFANPYANNGANVLWAQTTSNLSGTWKAMTPTRADTPGCSTTPWAGALICRVS
jgi:hypothetical protein